MELQAFVKDIALKYSEDFYQEKRLSSARTLAEKYKINPPMAILMFTHPKLAKLPISERCLAAGITEEEFMLIATSKGFQQFVDDYRKISKDIIDLQSLTKVSEAISKDRVITSGKDGENVNADYSLETKALSSGNEVQAPVQVNLSFFDKARERARQLEAIPTVATVMP